MNTKLFKIRSVKKDAKKIKEAAEIIKKGGLVAFPTETVYGLGANGLNGNAVKKIFAAKSRPQDNPLILHVSDIEQVNPLVKEIPDKAKILMEKFWPGPLTLVMKKSEIVPDTITAGLDSVAVRMPENKIALELIKSSNCPIAAPSANSSGKPSPTNAHHVLEDLNGKIDAVIDGGSVDIGIESTVVDLTQNTPRILRPGKITKEQLEKTIGDFKEKNKNIKKPKSPGMKYRHYSPKARIIPIKNKTEINNFFKKHHDKKIKVLKYKNEIQMAKNLFRDFRKSDKKGYEVILIKEVKDEGFGHAIMDKIKKASGKTNS